MIQSTRSYTGYSSGGRKGGTVAASIDKDLKYQQRREQQAKYWKKIKEDRKDGDKETR